MRTKIALLLSLLLICVQTYAEDIWNKTHEIDRWTEKALKEANGGTSEIIAVYSAAYSKWDMALNSAYKSLMKKLPDNEKKLLRDSQRKWLAYKNTEFKFIPVHIQREGGTLSKVIAHERMNNFVRARVIELEAYIVIFDTPP